MQLSTHPLQPLTSTLVPGLWKALEALADEGRLIARIEVYRELKRKDDEIFEWAKGRKEAVFVEIVQGLIGGDTLTNPAKVENIGDVLNSCVTVDAGLTAGEIRRLALDMQLSADAVTAAPLPLAGVSTWGGGEVIVPDQNLMRGLANALRAEQPRVWVAKQADPWAPLAQLPPR